MTSTKLQRGLWIVVVGAGIALGAGSGIAAAESDAADAGPGPSTTESSQTAQPATAETRTSAKDADNKPVSNDGPTGADKPTSTVIASTVTVRRDDTETAEPVNQVTPAKHLEPVVTPAKHSEPVTPAKHSEPATSEAPATVQSEAVAPEPVAAKETPAASTPQTSGPQGEATPIAENPIAVPQPQVAAAVTVDRQTDPKAEAGADPAPVAEVTQVAALRSLAAPAALRSLAAPAAQARPTPGPIATVVISVLSALGLMPPLPPAPTYVVGVPAQPDPGTSLINGVTGVKVGSSNLAIPVGGSTYTGAADWYFPTQADGTVQAQGVMLLQHGFLGSNFWYSALAQDAGAADQQHRGGTQHLVVPLLRAAAVAALSAVPMQQGVAALFIDPTGRR